MSSGGYLIRDPLRLLEAEAWVIARLGDSARARHSRFVGRLMQAAAARLAPDEPELWEITGLVHDLDYLVVDGDWQMHGRMTVAWLEGRLPLTALWAIAAHDHRSGIISDAPMARALRLGDALAVLDAAAGRSATLGGLRDGAEGLARLAGRRSWLAGMIVSPAAALGLELAVLAGWLSALPEQPEA